MKSPNGAQGFEDWLRERGSHDSKTMEKQVEHLFLADVLQECWFGRRQLLEVSRTDVDVGGHDLILWCNGTTRHVQLKASRQGARTRRQTVRIELAERAGGCVVWVEYSVDPTSRRANLSYLWREAKDLPDQRGRRPRGGSTRENTRIVTKGDFERLGSTDELVDRLFPAISKEKP